MAITDRTKLGRTFAPILPVPPVDYDPAYHNQLNRALRLYFERIDTVFGTLLDNAGGRFVSFPYGSFQSTATQTVTADTATVMTLNTTDLANGVSIVDGSKIYVTNPGIYNLQWSGQFKNTDTQDHPVTVWLRQGNDGGTPADVAGTGGNFDVPSSHGGIPGTALPAWNYFVRLQAEDYVQLWWSTVSAQVTMPYLPAQTGPVRPATASLIATLSFVSALP